jgi:hypothetical protein
MALLLLSTVGAALTAVAMSETMVAANHRLAVEASYAADVAMAWALSDLPADAGLLLGAVARGTLWDGSGTERRLSDGSVLDLNGIRNLANCGMESTCSPSDLTVDSTGDRPWGANNPVWQLFAHAPLPRVMPAVPPPPFYVTVLVADDPTETDGDPGVDEVHPSAPGAGVVLLRAEAFGPRGAHASFDAAVRLASESGDPVRVLAIRRQARPR